MGDVSRSGVTLHVADAAVASVAAAAARAVPGVARAARPSSSRDAEPLVRVAIVTRLGDNCRDVAAAVQRAVIRTRWRNRPGGGQGRGDGGGGRSSPDATTHRNPPVTGLRWSRWSRGLSLVIVGAACDAVLAIAPAAVCARRLDGPSVPHRTVHSAYFVPITSSRCELSGCTETTGGPPWLNSARRHRTCTSRSSSTTPAVSPWSPTSRAAAITASCAGRSPRSCASNTAAPAAPRSTPATARASCCRSRTSSTARSSTSSCPPRAPTPRAWRSCPPTGPPRWRPRSTRSPPRRACACSAGASCPPTPTAPTSGRPRAA